VSSQRGKPSTRAVPTPAGIAGQLGLRWCTPGKDAGLLTWDALVDLAYVAYWERRPQPAARVSA
jgi:hypothetical protein